MNIRKIIIRQAKLSIILLILGMCGYGLPGRGFCADYSQHEDFGVKKAGDIISFTVTPPGKVLTGQQVDPGDYPWSGGPATWSWTIPPVNAGVHNGLFRGTYQPPGTGPGPSREYTWEADTKAEVSEIAPPQPEQGWWDCTYVGDGGWFSGWGTDWMDVKRRSKDDWEDSWHRRTDWYYHGAPYSIAYATYYVPPLHDPYDPYGDIDYHAGYEARNGKYYAGPFPTNVAHAVIVEARSVRYGSEFSPQGAIGPENVWVKIIDVTNSYAKWEVSKEYGSLAIPLDPPHEPWTDITNTLNGRGNTTETTNEVWQNVLKVDIEQAETNVCKGGANVKLNLTEDSYLDKGTANWSSEPAGISGSGRSISFSPNALTPGTYTVTAQSSLQSSCRDTCLVRVLKVDLIGSVSTTRGNSETYTATVTPDGLNPTFNWKFTGGGKTVQKNTGTTRTWRGVMVVNGTIEVTATIGSAEVKNTLSVAVNARNWNADVQAPNVDRVWGDSPQNPGQLGEAQATGILANDINVIVAKIADEGPNNGFTYVTAHPVQHGMNIRINQYLNNSGSAFSLAQGNAGDVQVIPLGQGQANSTIITAGTNGVIDTTPSGDDAIVGETITSGPDGIANTEKAGDDVQFVAIGKGQTDTTIINAGPSTRLNIAANPSGDDVTTGTYITSGADGVANTEIDNRSEVSRATLLNAVEKHEGTSGNKNETSHWTYWYQIEAADIDMNEEAEDEVGAGTADELKTAVVNKIEPIRVRLYNAWVASSEPPVNLPAGTWIDFIYPDPSWPAYKAY